VSFEIAVVSRDRGDGHGQASTRAAPRAVQFVDRWHLMENVSAAFSTRTTIGAPDPHENGWRATAMVPSCGVGFRRQSAFGGPSCRRRMGYTASARCRGSPALARIECSVGASAGSRSTSRSPPLGRVTGRPPCACAAETVGTPPRSRCGSPHADRWILGIILFPPNPIGSGRAGVDGRNMRHSNAYGAAAACRNWRREREIFAALTAGQSTASSL